VAGVFLFLPLLARLGFDTLVRQAGYPGSRLVPAAAALLSLLTLKLLDKERRSHISDFNFDEALRLFAGMVQNGAVSGGAAVGQAFQPDSLLVRLESLTYGPECYPDLNHACSPA